MLILDEPTSGVDPLERDRFWELLIDLSRNEGVTIFVSTHFMNEAARCDRISLMDSGHVLATDTPAGLIAARGAATLEDAFISYLEAGSGNASDRSGHLAEAPQRRRRGRHNGRRPARRPSVPQRLFAYTIREQLELLRDPIRIGFALFGTAFLMLVFGFGISTDVNNLSFAVLDRDQSHESRAYLEELRGSTYFSEKAPLADYADLQRRLQNGDIEAGIEIPPGFGRDIERGRPAWVSAWIDGARPFIAQTIRGYLQAMQQLYLTDPAVKTTLPAPPPATVEIRFKYNQNFDSIYAMVPSTMSLLLALFPAILMALAIVREKELGSITNLYVTPVTRIEFLLGKQLPYIAFATVNFALMFLMALFVFRVPLKGSFSDLAARRRDLRHHDNRLWHGDLGLHPHADRRAVRHGDPDHPAGDDVFRHAGSGILDHRDRTDHGPRLPDDLFPPGQRRHLHQGPRLFRPRHKPGRSRDSSFRL